jgi:hypothetical protein
MDASHSDSTVTDVAVVAASPGQAASRELARGILLSQQAIMVPDPPSELLRTSRALIAVIAQQPASGGPSEAIPVASITSARLRSPGLNSACVMIRLADSSQYAPAVSRHSANQLMEALGAHQGNLWEAMSSLGYRSLAGRPDAAQPPGTPAGDGPWDYEANSLKEFASWYCVTHPRSCKN